MKILSITAQKPNSTGSGVYLTELVNNWHLSGHEQAVVAGVYEEDDIHFPEGVMFYPVWYKSEELPFAIAGMSDEMPYESVRYCDLSEKMLRQYREAFQKTIANAVERLQPEVIICHHIYLLTAMVREWYPDRKVIGVSHGSDIRQICKNPLQREYIKEQIRKLDGITALHGEHKREIQHIYGCEEEKIQILGVGYNQNVFYQEEKREKPYKQLVFAGKVTEKKGIFSLFRAIEQLPYKKEQLVVKIAGGHGTKKEREQMKRLVQKSKYRIEILGALPQKQLADLFRESDVFVLPSFFEGLPLVNIEAMACGCQVVCSEIPGIREWYDTNLPGHQIELVKLPGMRNTDEPEEEELPDFEKRLSAAIQKILEREEAGRPELEQISWKGISRKILEIFCEEGETGCL